jgi:hypothetical protein
MAAALALTKKNQKAKKTNKDKKGNKTSEDFLRTRPLPAALTRNTRIPAV